jgi:3-deoxy-manno-octulosonate cytidylyltransferase (CMP-KDO synthetase)
MKFLVIIPARLRSTRLAEKALIKINGIPMIVRTFLRCNKVLPKSKIIVATDDIKIMKVCDIYKVPSILTSKNCLTGSDRVAEVAKKINADIYINLQGDEPIFPEKDIVKFIKEACKNKNKNKILNGYCKIDNKNQFFSHNVPKVSINQFNELLYMTRAPIPSNKQGLFKNGLRQVCIYSYPKKILIKNYGKNKKKTFLEKNEDIEILRPLEKGYKITMVKLSKKSIAIDTKTDLNKLLKILN